ncbi:hypothetical protein Tco_1545137 [Tanacetum coccineum]
MEVFIRGLPRSTEGNITASKPQTLEEAITITQRLMDQEVDINKKTENQAKMTKLSMEWKRLCKIKAKVQKCQSQSQY